MPSVEMDSPKFRNGIMDACFQSSSPIKRLALCQKLGLTPFSFLLLACDQQIRRIE
jgi:hypothetical protein